MLLCVLSYLIQTITGGIMKNTSTNKSKSGKYYWWAQSPPVDILTRKFRNQSPKIKDSFHMLRDSTACLFLSELIKGKYDFGSILYNIPSDIFFPKMNKSDLLSSPLPNLSNNDIILHTTRPALNDDKGTDKKCLFKSGSLLEKTILKNMERFFLYCNRQRIILSKDIKYDGPYRAIKFNLRIDAHIACKANVYDQLSLEKISKKSKVSRSNKTVGYIVFIPKLISDNSKEIGSPSVLSVFSLNGAMTHVWSYLVLAQHTNLINEMISSKKPRIILAEFSPEIPNDIIPSDLAFIVGNVDSIIKVDVTL